MSLWRQLTRGVRALTQREKVETELTDEIDDFFARAEAERREQTMSAQDAERMARRAERERDRAEECLCEYGWEHVVETTLGDCRYALRRLCRSPAFTLVTVLTLAVGIGASTAILSAVKPVLIEALPYPDADRVVELSDRDSAGAPLDVTYGTFVEVQARGHSFDALAIADRWRPSLEGRAESEQLGGDLVSPGYFRVLGISPALGRDFDARDDVAGAPAVAIVTHGLAERSFGTAEAALDQTISLDGVAHRIIGIMPGDFENVLAPAADVWAPRRFRTDAPFDSGEWGHHLRMIGRLAPRVSVEQASAELVSIGADPTGAFPRPEWAAMASGLSVESLKRSVTAGARPVLLAIVGSVLLLLLIACANVTNLLLARSVRRRSELAVRAAIGAGRGRIARQLLTESLCLAVLGGLLALPFALVGIDAIVALAPAELPRVEAIRFDTDVFVIALVLATGVGLAVGLVPAFNGARTAPRAELQTASRALGGLQHALRRGLVVTEIALALVLLVGAGLMYRSVSALLSTPAGFEASDRLMLEVVAPSDVDLSPEAGQRFFATLLEDLQGLSGVADVALASQLPLGGNFDAYGMRFDSAAEGLPEDTGGALRYVVTPDWFETMRIPLRAGRLLATTDGPEAPPVVLLSESFAARRFPGRSAIGERVRIGPDLGQPDLPSRLVVGIVGDVKHASLALAAPDAFYVPLGQWPWVDRAQSIVVRTAIDPSAMVNVLKGAIRGVDPDAVVARVAILDDLVAASEAERRFTLTVFSVFALAAVALAGFGLYGVVAGSVEERARELGLRSALGAPPGSLLVFIVRQGFMLTLAGVMVGAAAAAFATRGLQSMLFGITALDPLTYLGVIVLIVAVTLAASWVPARRAARISPTEALRTE
jgi:predicted permease